MCKRYVKCDRGRWGYHILPGNHQWRYEYSHTIVITGNHHLRNVLFPGTKPWRLLGTGGKCNSNDINSTHGDRSYNMPGVDCSKLNSDISLYDYLANFADI
jgi:hypothetical protein